MQYTDETIRKRKKKNDKIKKIIKTITYIVLVPLLIYNISLIIQALANPNKTPSFFGIKTYVIVSGSMMPELNIGDIVIVKSAEDYQEGDIISFRQGQNVITHRISEILKTENGILYKTKGDNNNTEDSGMIEIDAIEGKTIGKIPRYWKNCFNAARKDSDYIHYNYILYVFIKK